VAGHNGPGAFVSAGTMAGFLWSRPLAGAGRAYQARLCARPQATVQLHPGHHAVGDAPRAVVRARADRRRPGKPKIAIVNSSSQLASCFSHLDEIVQPLKQAITDAGGVAFEVRTAAPSDAITSAGAAGYGGAGSPVRGGSRGVVPPGKQSPPGKGVTCGPFGISMRRWGR
jgi:Dehydratase family